MGRFFENVNMKNSFINLLKEPDSVLFQYEDSCIRFEEPDSREERNSKLEYRVRNCEAEIVVYPSEKPIKRIKLRWRGDMSDVILVLGDAFDVNCSSSYGFDMFACWHGVIPERKMPWYFHAYDGEKLNCFGVKTGPDAVCYFQCDAVQSDPSRGGNYSRCRLLCGGNTRKSSARSCSDANVPDQS